jgi:phage host-nuclease inhibitor protein Gam
MKTLNFKVLREELSQEEHVKEEIGMVYSNLLALCHHTEDLMEMMDNNEINTSTGLDAWVIEKIALAHKDIQTVLEFLQYGQD